MCMVVCSLLRSSTAISTVVEPSTSDAPCPAWYVEALQLYSTLQHSTALQLYNALHSTTSAPTLCNSIAIDYVPVTIVTDTTVAPLAALSLQPGMSIACALVYGSPPVANPLSWPPRWPFPNRV